ncbi:MAG: hypothetical protein Q9214_006204, partial [Letrouitia sp. 1 TL-2023]
MPPKQATLGKFFGQPNGAKTKAKQSLPSEAPEDSELDQEVDGKDSGGASQKSSSPTAEQHVDSDDRDVPVSAQIKPTVTRGAETSTDGLKVKQ